MIIHQIVEIKKTFHTFIETIVHNINEFAEKELFKIFVE